MSPNTSAVLPTIPARAKPASPLIPAPAPEPLAVDEAAGRINVLVIVIDDAGIDKLELYGTGSNFPPTPRLLELAQNGVLFHNAYASPVCGPTRAAIQTGRYAFRTGFGTNIKDTDAPPAYKLPDGEICLPEMIRLGLPNVAYACAAFGKWHLTYNIGDDLHPNRNGYSHYAGCISNVGSAGNGTGHFDWRKVTDGRSIFITAPPFDESQWDASVNRADALAWINAIESPFFAYVAFNPPHAPFTVPPYSLLSAETRAKFKGLEYLPGDVAASADAPKKAIAFYDAMIEATDTEIGRLLDGIAPRKRKQTMVIVIGDNGTPGDVIEPPFDPRHAKRTIYQQGIRVPMIASGPLVLSAGRTSMALVHAVDIWRTIAEMVGADVALAVGDTKIDSVSFLPLLEDPQSSPPRTQLFAETFKPNGALRFASRRCLLDGTYKYIAQMGTEEFYHIAKDALETNDLVKQGMTARELARFNMLKGEMNALLAS